MGIMCGCNSFWSIWRIHWFMNVSWEKRWHRKRGWSASQGSWFECPGVLDFLRYALGTTWACALWESVLVIFVLETELSKSTLTSLLALKMQRWSKSNLHSLRKVGPRDYIVQTYTNLVGPGFYAFFSRAHSVLQVNTILLGTSHWDNLTLSFCDSVLVLQTFHRLQRNEKSKDRAVGTVLNSGNISF